MKRRVLSMILALCMIVGLLPAVAVPHAHAAVTTRTIQSMKGTDYEMTLTATSDGATVSYTKNQEITLKDVIELIDGPIAIARCLDSAEACSLNCDKTACIYHHIFDTISIDLARKLAKITISDVINKNYSLN